MGKKTNPSSTLFIFIILIAGLVVSRDWWAPGGLGLDGGQSTVTTTERTLPGNITRETTVTTNPGKTLWDWLGLLGAPLSLALLGYWFQNYQQRQTESAAEVQRYLAAETATAQRQQAITYAKEEALQGYFDRVSKILIDKALFQVAAESNISPANRALLESAGDVIRALTLSMLRRFENDSARKSSVIRFLFESEIVSKLNLSLRGADLSGTNLRDIVMSDTDLRGANLRDTDLRGAILRDIQFDSNTLWPAREMVVMAREIPGALRQKLDL